MDINTLDKTLIGEVWTSPDLYANLESLCDFGSRFAGTPSERQARDFIFSRFATYGLRNVRLDPFTYMGWRRGTCQAQLVAPPPVAAAFGPLAGLLAQHARRWAAE